MIFLIHIQISLKHWWKSQRNFGRLKRIASLPSPQLFRIVFQFQLSVHKSEINGSDARLQYASWLTNFQYTPQAIHFVPGFSKPVSHTKESLNGILSKKRARCIECHVLFKSRVGFFFVMYALEWQTFKYDKKCKSQTNEWFHHLFPFFRNKCAELTKVFQQITYALFSFHCKCFYSTSEKSTDSIQLICSIYRRRWFSAHIKPHLTFIPFSYPRPTHIFAICRDEKIAQIPVDYWQWWPSSVCQKYYPLICAPDAYASLCAEASIAELECDGILWFIIGECCAMLISGFASTFKWITAEDNCIMCE